MRTSRIDCCSTSSSCPISGAAATGSMSCMRPAISVAAIRFCPVLSCRSRAIRRRSSSCAVSSDAASSRVVRSARRSSSIRAPSSSTGIERPIRNSCKREQAALRRFAGEQARPVQGPPGQDHRHDQDRRAGALLAVAHRRPQHQRQRSEQQHHRRRKARGGQLAGELGGDDADAGERQREQRGPDLPARHDPARPPGAVGEPDQEYRPDREARQRVGEIPVRPEQPIIAQRSAAQDRHEGAAQRRDRRSDAGRDHDVERSVVKGAEPGRAAEHPPHPIGVEQCHQAVGGERHQQLRHRHADAELGDHVGNERGSDVEPPLPLRHDQQRAKQDDVGRPEQREDLVGQRADEERGLRSEKIGERQQQRPIERCGRDAQSRPGQLRRGIGIMRD